MSSRQYLIKSLKFRKDYLKQIEKKSTDTNNNNEYDIFDLQKKEKAKEEESEVDIFSLPISKSEAKLKIKKNNAKNYFFLKKNIAEFDTNSLAYKYYPNFNSIDKNVPSVKMIKPSFSNKINKKYSIFNHEIKKKLNADNSIKINDKINKENKKNKNIMLNNIGYLNTINDYKNFKYNKSLKNKSINLRNNKLIKIQIVKIILKQ